MIFGNLTLYNKTVVFEDHKILVARNGEHTHTHTRGDAPTSHLTRDVSVCL